MQQPTELQCPYCPTTADVNADSSRENPSQSFDRHYTGVTCRNCEEYYEIAYRITTGLRCPECHAATPENWSSVGPVTSSEFLTAQFTVTCSECDCEYKLEYTQEYRLYWEGGDMKSTENSTPPRNYEGTE